MSAFAFKRRELKNAFIYFVPVGTVLSAGNGSASLTVAYGNVFPDNDPVTNYTDYQFDDIEDVKEVRGVKSEQFMIASASGGYDEDPEDMVTSRAWTASTHKTNAIVKQLQHGLASVPAANTAQSYGVKKDNKVEGVLLIVVQNKSGTVIERVCVWAALRIVNAGDIGPATAKIELSWKMMDHASNSIIIDPAA